MVKPRKFDLKEFARRGAEARVAELVAELDSIYAVFADLRQRRQTTARATATPVRRRKPMSAAQKKEVSVRMKKYWADRRKANEAAKAVTKRNRRGKIHLLTKSA